MNANVRQKFEINVMKKIKKTKNFTGGLSHLKDLDS